MQLSLFLFFLFSFCLSSKNCSIGLDWSSLLDLLELQKKAFLKLCQADSRGKTLPMWISFLQSEEMFSVAATVHYMQLVRWRRKIKQCNPSRLAFSFQIFESQKGKRLLDIYQLLRDIQLLVCKATCLPVSSYILCQRSESKFMNWNASISFWHLNMRNSAEDYVRWLADYGHDQEVCLGQEWHEKKLDED